MLVKQFLNLYPEITEMRQLKPKKSLKSQQISNETAKVDI